MNEGLILTGLARPADSPQFNLLPAILLGLSLQLQGCSDGVTVMAAVQRLATKPGGTMCWMNQINCASVLPLH